MSDGNERRRAARTATHWPIQVKTEANEKHSERPALLRNLSRDGLYFEIDANLRTGSTVDCYIELDGEGPLRDCLAIHCQASVVRAEPAPASPNHLEVGARILSLSIAKAAEA
jgi:hypothetical protein